MRGKAFALALVIAVAGAASTWYARQDHPATTPVQESTSTRFDRLADPPRTVVTTGGAVEATLTDGARTVVLAGPARTFRDPRSGTTVTGTAWVRLAPQPWAAGAERAAWFGPWLAAATHNTAPDVLAVALQYVDGAPPVRDATGRRIAGDATFAPNADYDDYLTRASGAVDSAGFVRLVYGFREGFPLPALPRTAAAMAAAGPGAAVVPASPQRVTDCSRLQAGDLVFFTRTPDGGGVTRAGIYLGRDSGGHHRVLISGRAAGPAFGKGSTLDGESGYAKTFRAARRL
ncbi:NlpC/P60 family protein [Amycolatopsis sp. OK19-0408]|uniref:NlpC/P60 family protein n=1 Tax=Amycolatopsis iheyensis TaxID=2945988 RepID=A0A9X2SIH2_9PSEU|nr:NlpC/P60 family protein [Amycolatopsis iheyensis]MCR6482933.1 NlpC/P60 family protein [Amycolatopsis iheyensis]